MASGSEGECWPSEQGQGQIFTAKPQQRSRELFIEGTGEQEDKAFLPAGDGARADPVSAHLAT